MKTSNKPLCYCCNNVSTTKEHVPPECFFPKNRHLPKGSKDYRQRLITVPSCEKHNNDRAIDDEYTAAIITVIADSDIIDLALQGKWLRAFKRNGFALWKTITQRSQLVRSLNNRSGLLIPEETLAINLDMIRINRVFQGISRGLYYHEHATKWDGEIEIYYLSFLKPDLSPQETSPWLFELNQTFSSAATDPKSPEFQPKGSNPEVFYYQVYRNQEKGTLLFRMVFYGEVVVLAFLRPNKSLITVEQSLLHQSSIVSSQFRKR